MLGTYQKHARTGVELAFLTDTVPGSYAKVIAVGGTAVAAPKRMPLGLEVAYLHAQEGTLIGLSEPTPTLG